MTDPKILDKIKKCLALAQSPEPHEAAAAMRQAQKLMELHNISLGDVDRAEISETLVQSKVSVSKVKDWELAIVNTCAKAFGCSLMWQPAASWMRNPYGHFIVIGIKSQVELAAYTTTVMVRQLTKARANYVATLTYHSREMKSQLADAFCKGWIAEVRKTVHEFALDGKTSAAIAAYIEDKRGGSEEKKAKMSGGKPVSASGFLAGQAAGKGVSINRPMNAAAGNLMIGA